MSYIKIQTDALVRSFRIKNYWHLMGIVFIKYVLLIILSYMVLAIFVKSINSIQPLFSLLDMFRSTGELPASAVTEFLNYKSMLNRFIYTSVLLLAIYFLIILLVLTFFSSLIICYLRNEIWNKGLMIKLLIPYAIMSTIYFSLMSLVFFKSNNLGFIAIAIMVLTSLYIYALVIHQISLEDKHGYIKNLMKGWSNLAKLHWTLPMIMISYISFLALILILLVSVYYLKIVSIPLLVLGLLSYELWMTNYYHALYKHERFINE